ncbi:MAG: tetratricopeptide repeat protein [Alphaproteobacteria bacterium]|nr:tetratricopeptide repeat protein [Alphaproteobacteria bacterium]
MQSPLSYKVFTQEATGAKAKQLQKAGASCRAILKTAPGDVKCMHALALIECQLGRLIEAQKWLARALAVSPDSADLQCHYGLVLLELEKYDKAVTAFTRTIALVPDHLEAHYRLGSALSKKGEIKEAEEVYRRVLLLKPDHVDALNNLGNIMNKTGKPAEAINCFRRAIAADPTFVMAYNNVGLTLVSLGQLDAAEAFYRHAIALKPDYPEAINNLGIVFGLVDRFDEAKFQYRKALELRPNYPEALSNLGNVCKDCGEMDDAIRHYKKSVSLKDSAEFRHNLALTLLAVGRFDEGWREYESRWGTKQLGSAQRSFKQPQWQGEDAEGRTLLIHAEQGFGDTLQFCRYAKLAKARGMRVIMAVPRALVKLIGSLDGVDHAVVDDRPLPNFDLHCPMLSLPLAFGTRWDTIPANIPYLAAKTQAVAAWGERLPDAKGALRVGLVWAGSERKGSQDLIATNRRRSLAPELLRPLINVPGVQFYSLQKTGTPAPADFNLIDYMADCGDFADTAALVANLDLVISVDTAMVHLTGALGKPVWVLNRFNSCWRWFREGEHSPWYPTLRLFRQPRFGDWESVIAHVRDELRHSKPPSP